jgi:hypothetical protein
VLSFTRLAYGEAVVISSGDRSPEPMLAGLHEGPSWDCPECGVKASVRADVCEICFAELDEFRPDPLDPALDVMESIPQTAR